jgi:long-chain acyl-CoA synthetase
MTTTSTSRAPTVPARLRDQARNRSGAPAYHVLQPDGSWRATSWAVYYDEVLACARALSAHGVGKGGRTAVLGFNRPEWCVFDLATMAVGGAPAGIYTTCSPPEVQYIIEHAEATVVLLEDEGQWAKVDAERDKLPKLSRVVMMKGAPAIDDPLVLSWEDFLQEGAAVPPADIDRAIDELEPADLATLIYTSGTTGPPKGVMLTHANLAWTALVVADLFEIRPTDRVLSYLPLSHIAEQMFTLHGPITHGFQVYFAESIDRVPDHLKDVQPTILFAVPRIWEKLHAGIAGKLSQATGVKAKLAAWAMGVGREVSALKCRGQAPSGLLGLQYKLADKLIFSKVKAAVGVSEMHVGISGAAPIAGEVLEFLASLDIIVHEVYGQSEDCGPTTFSRPSATRFGTVGQAVPGVEVAIADDGEIIVRGPNVFAGYLNDKAATAEALDEDGWLHSGDLGALDADGFLSITGRKKEIIITAGGKNIAPKNIEAALKQTELIAEAVLIGDRRKFLSALVWLDDEALARKAEAWGMDVDAARGSERLQQQLDQDVEGVNALFARVEHVRKFTVCPEPLSVDAGELTPTLKVKRRVVAERYAETIEAMYAG